MLPLRLVILLLVDLHVFFKLAVEVQRAVVLQGVNLHLQHSNGRHHGFLLPALRRSLVTAVCFLRLLVGAMACLARMLVHLLRVLQEGV